jgi:predicted ArsR family transcriptional regulator
MLADAVAELDRAGAPVRRAVRKAARAEGGRLVAELDAGDARGPDAVTAVLESHGFEPRGEGGRIVLGNCPFHRLAREHTDLVCGMNLEMLRVLTDASDAGLTARLDPQPGRCCVVLEAAGTR